MKTITRKQLLTELTSSDRDFYLYGHDKVTVKLIASDTLMLAYAENCESMYPSVFDVMKQYYVVDDEGRIRLYHESDRLMECPVALTIRKTVTLFAEND